MKKNIFFILLLVTFAFAAKPVPFEYNKVRILYVIDSFDDEKVEAALPRSVLDSILQDVDSVYFAPFGACDCDCAGDDDKAHIYWKSSTHTRVHEFAHLLGLDDKYKKPYMDFAKWGKPFKGYDEDNLMTKGLKLNESQIEEMWSPGPFYPAYGYEYNEIKIEKGE